MLPRSESGGLKNSFDAGAALHPNCCARHLANQEGDMATKKAAKKATKKKATKKATKRKTASGATLKAVSRARATENRKPRGEIGTRTEQPRAGLDPATCGAFVMAGMRDHELLLRHAIELGGGELAFVARAMAHAPMLNDREKCIAFGSWYVNQTVKRGEPPAEEDCRAHLQPARPRTTDHDDS